MKRKAKFQEGGAVEEPARRPTPRSRMSRMSEAARTRQAEARAAVQREIERLNALRDVEDFNRRVQRGQVDAETARRMGAQQMPSGRQDFTTTPEGTTRRGTGTGREMVPFQEPGAPARPSASRALAEVATPRPMPVGSPRPRVGGNVAALGGALAMEAAGPLADYGRRNMDRRAEEARAAAAQRMQAARNRELDAMRAALPEGPDVEAERAARGPAARSRPRPSAPAAPAASRIRGTSADELNEMELRRIRAERQMEEEGRRRAPREEDMGGSGNIGAASARERGEQVGPPGDYNFKKGGMVKPKKMMKGGTVPAPKKKMMKGGAVAKPKSKVSPFKKGGAVKKRNK